MPDSLRPLSACGADGEVYAVPLNLINAGFQDVILEFNHYKEVSGGVYSWTTVRQDYPYDFSTLLKRDDSVKYKIIVEGCDSAYTNTISIRDFQRAYGHPWDCKNIKVGNSIANIPEGTDTFLYAVLDTLNQWLLESSNADSFFKWEKYVPGIGYVEVPGSHNDTLFINASRCTAGQYRVNFKSTSFADDCFWMWSCSDSNVTVNYSSDLWARDSQADTSAEPNTLSAGDYWKSPDLWNNVDPLLYSSQHQNPEYKSTSRNRIHLKVRNKGTSYSANSKVFLYWTLPSTNEYWPLHWTYDSTDNFFYNAFDSNSYPLGSEINDTGIWIGPLAPGTDTIVNYDWYPPNPAWYYYYDTGGVKHDFNGAMLCLLARIVECEESAPFGMSSPEVLETTINVKNNNNIVTRNTILVDDPLIDAPFPGYIIRYPILVGPCTDSADDAIDIGLQSLANSGYFTHANVYVSLDDTLYDAWSAGGSLGDGYLREGEVFRVTDPLDFMIENILMETPYRGIIEIILQIDSLPETTPIQFEFLVTQYSGLSTVPDGGVYIQGILPAQPPALLFKTPKQDLATENDSILGFDLWQQAGEGNIVEQDSPKEADVLRNMLYAYPNPFTDEVNFYFELAEGQNVGFEIYNSLGAVVGRIDVREYTMGTHQVTFNGSRLAPGMYLCKAKVGHETKTIRLVIVR